MTAEQTFSQLRAALQAAGISFVQSDGDRADLADPSQAWEAVAVFVSQAHQIVDEPSYSDFDDDPVPQTVDRFRDGDMLLYEAVGSQPGELLIALTRQFGFTRPDDRQCEMKALLLDLVVPYEGARISEQLWGAAGPAWTPDEVSAWSEVMAEGERPGLDGEGASGWWAEVRGQPGLQLARDLTPTRAFIAFDTI